MYDSHLTFQDHIQEKINKAYSAIGLIKRNIMLYKAMVRPHVEYANSIWSPYKKGDIEAIEKVQKTATKLVIYIIQTVTIQRTFITIKFTYFEIQTITRRHDRGIQNYTYSTQLTTPKEEWINKRKEAKKLIYIPDSLVNSQDVS